MKAVQYDGEDEEDAAVARAGMVLFRLPFAVTIGAFEILASLASWVLAGDMFRPVGMASGVQLPAVRGMQAISQFATQGVAKAIGDLEQALDAGEDFAGGTHFLAMQLPLLATVWRFELTGAGADPAPARTAFLRAVDRLISNARTTHDARLPLLGVCAAKVEYPDLAREFASRAVHLAPDDPEAAAGCAEILVFAGMLAAAEEDILRAQQRWPGHAAILRAEAFLTNKRAGK